MKMQDHYILLKLVSISLLDVSTKQSGKIKSLE